ncbi:MAG: hypothetical protein EBU40_11540, partial [Proteobacteria bacterium]|nr:hypothetical protein [Pseudomonadota bacterium]
MPTGFPAEAQEREKNEPENHRTTPRRCSDHRPHGRCASNRARGDYPKMTRIVNDINGEQIAFSVYDGDIKDGSSLCTPDQYAGATELFNSIKVPTIYVPGDNEWTDCHR